MKRIADVSVVCVAAVLIVAMLRAPSTESPAPTLRGFAQAGPPAAETGDGTVGPEAKRDAESSKTTDTAPAGWSSRRHSDSWGDRVPGRPGRGRNVELTLALTEVCLEVAGDIDAELAHKLRELYDRDPDECMKRIRQAGRLLDLALLKEQDESLYQLKLAELQTDAHVFRLAQRWRAAREEDRAADAASIEAELRGYVSAQIGIEFRNRENYLCRLRDLVEHLELELEKDRDVFAELVEQRLVQLAEGEQIYRRRSPMMRGDGPPEGDRPHGERGGGNGGGDGPGGGRGRGGGGRQAPPPAGDS